MLVIIILLLLLLLSLLLPRLMANVNNWHILLIDNLWNSRWSKIRYRLITLFLGTPFGKFPLKHWAPAGVSFFVRRRHGCVTSIIGVVCCRCCYYHYYCYCIYIYIYIYGRCPIPPPTFGRFLFLAGSWRNITVIVYV